MILAHVLGMRGHLLDGGVVLLLIILVCALIVGSWPSKSEPK